MSYADYCFAMNCKNIINTGFSDECFDVRPKWPDGTPAHTKKVLYVQNKYRLEKDSIPVMTLRKQNIKNAVDEILWIYQKKTSDIKQLNSHIWDSWDIGDGTIGRAYGHQIGKLSRHHKYTPGEDLTGIKYEVVDDWVYLSQTDAVLWDLKHNPGSRSILTNMYNHEDLSYMGLRPCAYSMHFIVTKEGNQLQLNGKLIQRSQDMLTANNWNVIQYSVLLQMFAQVSNMTPGIFVHEVSDMHLYDRHIPIVTEMINGYDEVYHDLLSKYTKTQYNMTYETFIDHIKDIPYPNPKFWINPEIKNFYDFTSDDVQLANYMYAKFEHKIPVAI